MPRRSFRGRKAARPRRRLGDWVYRGEALLPDGTHDFLESYGPNVLAQTSGRTNAAALILYDSHNHLAQGLTASQGWRMSKAGRAEGRKAVITGVDGTMYIQPDTWAVGSVIGWGFRIMAADQSPESGVVDVPAGYGMWTPSAPITASEFANDKRVLQERRFFKGFASNASAIVQLHFRWRGRKALAEGECLCLYMEGEPTSTNIQAQLWFRTRVIDEG